MSTRSLRPRLASQTLNASIINRMHSRRIIIAPVSTMIAIIRITMSSSASNAIRKCVRCRRNAARQNKIVQKRKNSNFIINYLSGFRSRSSFKVGY